VNESAKFVLQIHDSMCLRSWRWRSGKATSSTGLVTACAVESEPRVVLMRPHEKIPAQRRTGLAGHRTGGATGPSSPRPRVGARRSARVHRLVHAPESGNRRIVCRLSDRAAVVTRRRRRVTSFYGRSLETKPKRRAATPTGGAGCASPAGCAVPGASARRCANRAAARAEARELPFAANVLALGPRRRGLLARVIRAPQFAV
jgi:hypothetical protein